MIELLFNLLLLIISTEAITELVVKSEIFKPFREFLFNKKLNFFHSLVDCGYCFSVWAAFFVLIISYYFDNYVTRLIILGLVTHRLSNIVHFLFDKLRNN